MAEVTPIENGSQVQMKTSLRHAQTLYSTKLKSHYKSSRINQKSPSSWTPSSKHKEPSTEQNLCCDKIALSLTQQKGQKQSSNNPEAKIKIIFWKSLAVVQATSSEYGEENENEKHYYHFI